MAYLPQLGDVRGEAKEVKEEKLKLPYGALQTKGAYRKKGFYLHLKERQRLWGDFLKSITNQKEQLW